MRGRRGPCSLFQISLLPPPQKKNELKTENQTQKKLEQQIDQKIKQKAVLSVLVNGQNLKSLLCFVFQQQSIFSSKISWLTFQLDLLQKLDLYVLYEFKFC